MEKSDDNKDLVNEIFRVAHTLKGMAATMGFKKMTVLTHDMENVLSEIRNGKINISAELLDVLFQCLDALEQYIDQIIETGTEGDKTNQPIIDRLNLILEGKDAKASQEEAQSSESKIRKHLRQRLSKTNKRQQNVSTKCCRLTNLKKMQF